MQQQYDLLMNISSCLEALEEMKHVFRWSINLDSEKRGERLRDADFNISGESKETT